MGANGGKNWSEEEVILAIALYLLIDRPVVQKQAYTSNPWLVAVHRAIRRSVDAVYMKICNIAEVNPSDTGSALPNAGAFVRKLWKQYDGNWKAFWDRALPLLERNGVQVDIGQVLREEPSGVGEEVLALRRERLGQAEFRQKVMANYDKRCCITGIAIPDLLVASHIVPWSENEKSRLDPANGLCLNALHDKAFDRGLITIGKDYQVVLSDKLRQSAASKYAGFFLRYEGVRITLPTQDEDKPKEEYLEWHRNNVFQG